VTEYPRVPDFPDPNDPALFPRLTERQLEQVARLAEVRTFDTGELLFDQGQRDAPIYVLRSGAVDFPTRSPVGKRSFARAEAGTFVGDTAIFTGEPTIAVCVAAEPRTVLAMERHDLRRLVAEYADIGDFLLRTMTARREWLEGHGYGQGRLTAV
jgi:thioredoxin reductase (NADPH)